MQAQTILLFWHKSPPTATLQPIGHPNLFSVGYNQYLSKPFWKPDHLGLPGALLCPFTRRKMYVLRLKLVPLESCPILTNLWHFCRKFVWPTEATNYVFLVSPTYDDDTNPKLENPVKHFTGCHLGHKDEIIQCWRIIPASATVLYLTRTFLPLFPPPPHSW